MSLTILSAQNYSAKLKATIQASGKLGFTANTARALGLSTESFIKIARDDKEVDVLYLIVCKDNEDKTAFKVYKSGEYYFIKSSLLFSDLDYDFKKRTIIFDLTRKHEYDEEMNGMVYKMNRRERNKNTNKKEVVMK